MKISGKVYIHIAYTFLKLNLHWPPQQPQSETKTLGKLRMKISLSMLVITSEILTLREARML
jgi:hypothetical protein